MWSLFPELLGPMIGAFVAGSLIAWIVVTIVLPKRPTAADYQLPPRPGGP